MDVLKKVHEGSPNIIDLVRKEEVALIINTPTGRRSRRDGYDIRRAAVDYVVPYITTIQAAEVAADAILSAKKGGGIGVKTIKEYHGQVV